MRRVPAIALLLTSASVEALNVGSTATVKASAKSIAGGLVQLYPNANSANAAGTFGTSYSWWEDGAVWKSLIDYWALTGDTQWNSLIQQAISTQAGPNKDFMPVNEIATEGNADQAIWAITAMSAVEQSFPAGNINYLALAQSVFDQQVGRWDTSTCGGGFHSTFNPDNQTTYSFKDAFSVGTFFQLAARLAQHTQNGTYTYWASKAYDWAANIGIINTGSYSINNGAETSTNCSSPTGLQWSANAGTFLYGCALMYNITFSQTWVTRTQLFLTAVNNTFFQTGALYEPSCNNQCSATQRGYKALLVGWMARTAMSAPFTTAGVQAIVSQNGQAIAKGCSNGQNSICTVSGNTGLSEQLTALDSVNALLVGRPADVGGSGSSPSGASSAGPASPSAKSDGSIAFIGQGWMAVPACAAFILALL